MSMTTEEQTTAKAEVKPSLSRTLGAGIAGGTVFIFVSFLTFVLLGSGWLNDPSVQSAKLLAVMNDLEPLPLWQTAPHVIFIGYIVFNVGYAFLFRSVANAWPAGIAPRAWRLALVIWGLSTLFFEFLGPFNLLGEPLGLVVLELGFWAVTTFAASAVIVSILEWKKR
jgi:hypothetical protein